MIEFKGISPRQKVDISIRELWVALKKLSDTGIENITDEDLNLWTLVTAHSAMQERLETLTA